VTVREDVQRLEPGPLLDMFTLDATEIGGGILRFHDSRHTFGYTRRQTMVWQGEEFFPWPLQAEGFERTSNQQPVPKLRVGNIDGSIALLCMMFEDLVGATLTRQRTFGRYMDAVNYQKNLVVPSSDFEDPLWIPSELMAVVPNAALGVNGGMTLHKLIPNSVNTQHNLIYEVNGLDDDEVMSFSVYARKADYTFIELAAVGKDALEVDGAKAHIVVNMDTGGVGYEQSIGQNCRLVGEDVGGGLWRLSVSNFDVKSGATTPNIKIIVWNNADPDFAGDEVSGTYVGDAQVERGNRATVYQPLATVAEANPNADPTQEFPPEIWFIDRKSMETRDAVEFELASALDFAEQMLPRRQIIANQCPFVYRGPYCNYVGPPVATALDVPTSDPDLDRCGRRLSSCQLREWPDGILNFGGYPAAALIRV
jgi:lambda family phage minor tail protein L